MSSATKLIFFCGKMAAGKSTLAGELADREEAVLLMQDEFLDALLPGETRDIHQFVKYFSRLKNALTPHSCALLSKGISVVLDFPANTRTQRAWFRELIEHASVENESHFVAAQPERRSSFSATMRATRMTNMLTTQKFVPPTESN